MLEGASSPTPLLEDMKENSAISALLAYSSTVKIKLVITYKLEHSRRLLSDGRGLDCRHHEGNMNTLKFPSTLAVTQQQYYLDVCYQVLSSYRVAKLAT